MFGQTDDSDLDPDDIVLSVDLQEDGTASWSIEHRYRLSDDEAEEAFDSLQADVEDNQSAYVARFTDRMEPTVQSAQDATDRDMALENVRVIAEKRSLPREYGIVTYTFDWVGFATVDETTITAGDALAGFFLDEETRFVMSWPQTYSVQSVAPAPDEQRDRSVMWRGPTDFGTNEPSLVVTTAESPPDDDAAGEDTFLSQTAMLLGGGILTVLIASGAVLWWRRSQPRRDEAVDVDSAPQENDRAEHGPDGETNEPSWDLLSNEEKVMQLLEDNGGRIKQQQVVQTFDWSDANTSQVVRELRDEGKVETFRIGRENVIVLADDDGNTTI